MIGAAKSGKLRWLHCAVGQWGEVVVAREISKEQLVDLVRCLLPRRTKVKPGRGVPCGVSFGAASWSFAEVAPVAAHFESVQCARPEEQVSSQLAKTEPLVECREQR